MARIKACGFLIFRDDPSPSFLLMRHPDRWDLPKGRLDPGETNLECAFRELEEETGITASDIAIDESFKFKQKYEVKYEGESNVAKRKTLIIYLARLIHPVKIQLTEHEGFEWIKWNPPHQIQEKTIDPLLDQVVGHWKSKSDVA